MGKRLSAESRIVAAFAAGVLALSVAAGIAISDGREYVAAERRAEDLLQLSDVLSDLSSTIDTAQQDAPADRAPLLDSIQQEVAAQDREAVAERRTQASAARERFADVERDAALLAALLIGCGSVALAALLRGARVRRVLAERIAEETSHDPSTGLPNRRFFAEWLAYAIAHARREKGRVGVLFIDINGCGAVSELHGDHAADLLLVEIARRFRAASRAGDVFARLDTTEFALVTPYACEGRDLALLAQRLRDELNDPSQPPLADSPIGASIGIAFFPEDADDSAGVMAAANTAMYAARRAGRNHVAFHALAA